MKQVEKNAVGDGAFGDGALCRFLEWDSRFFGRNIACVTVEHLDVGQHEQVRLWCEDNAIDCLYFLADSDGGNINRTQANGFCLRDVRVTLELRRVVQEVEGALHSFGVAPYDPQDLHALRNLARISHRDTRFYRDGNFPTDLCDRLYETWIEKSCQGQADAVFVARLDGQAVGYVTCHLEANNDVRAGSIGLVGVAAEAQRKGFGQALIETAVQWFDGRGVERITVVTQGHNVAAQRLYQKCGFATCEVQFWFHRWFA
ncbi:MAG TPA: GNAT family N-acetyltransferase [Abditibacteriaceae bacterium]|jgi:RimJ/RimL family protein N-acetyltransferase